MNERAGQLGEQVKQAFNKVLDAWKKQDAAARRRILTIAIGLIALALGLVVVLNLYNGRYVPVYDNMSQNDVVNGRAALETAGIPARVTNGQLEVPARSVEAATGQLALQGIPSTAPGYNVIAEASGLTTTETEKQAYQVFQWQNRLQDTIKTFNGVTNAIVNLNIKTQSTRVWDTNAEKNSGSVVVHMQQGYVLGGDQAYAIRHLIGASVGIDPSEVVVMDQHGNLLAGVGQEYDVAAAAASSYLQRMNLESEVEERLREKAAALVSMLYPDANDWRIACTVQLDTDRVVEEIKEYFPLEGTNAGVVDEEELSAVRSPNEFAGGVAGETDNDDVPIYVDLNDDGVYDVVDFHRFRDYAVSYSLQQIERDGATLGSAGLTVFINDVLDADARQGLREGLANATNLSLEDVTVQGFAVGNIGGDGDGTGVQPTPGTLPPLYIFIAAAAIVALLIVLVLVLLLRSRGKKKRLAAEQALVEAEREEAERIQLEIEERKKQLKNAALIDESENAITNEVKEFARNNPEITASLLRNWLKED